MDEHATDVGRVVCWREVESTAKLSTETKLIILFMQRKKLWLMWEVKEILMAVFIELEEKYVFNTCCR